MAADDRPTVLVLRFSALGDVVLTAPAIRALRLAWPEARLLLVTHARYLPLAAQPWLDGAVGLAAGEPVRHLAARLRALAPQAALDLHGKLRGHLLRLALPRVRWARARVRPVARSLVAALGSGRAVPGGRPCGRQHAAVEALVGRRLPPEMLALVPTAAGTAAAAARLAAAGGGGSGNRRIALAPGAAWASKRWPPAAFAAVARALRGRGHAVVLLGSAAERPLTAAVAAAAPGCLDLAGALDLAALPAAIAACDALLANDSGPMHVGRAVGTPTCALFGPTCPAQFDFAGHAVVRQAPDCAPCSFHGDPACPRGHHRCLAALPVASALAALTALLAQGRAAPVRG